MKIYNSVTINICSGEILCEDSFVYYGNIAECKGGGGSTSTTIDKEYNARLAAIAESQQVMAEDYFKFWETDAKPVEQAQYAANLELVPLQTEAEKERIGFESEQMGYARELLPYQTETALTAMGGAKSLMEQAGDINQREWMGTAQADVAQGYAGAEAQINRQFTPGSPEHTKAMQDLRFQKAKAVGGARTTGRRAAETEKFKRTGAATQAAANLWRT